MAGEMKAMWYPGMPEDWVPLEAVAIVKCLDQDGDVRFYLNSTPGLSNIEQLGMLTAAAGTTQEDVNKGFRTGDDE